MHRTVGAPFRIAARKIISSRVATVLSVALSLHDD